MSVVAMSHSVLVETSRRFVQAFYAALAEGTRWAGHADRAAGAVRRPVSRHGGRRPASARLVRTGVIRRARPAVDHRVVAASGAPITSPTASSESGSAARVPTAPFPGAQSWCWLWNGCCTILCGGAWAGRHGQDHPGRGASALAGAHGPLHRAAFVSLEMLSDVRSVLDSLGRQVLPEGANWSVAQYPDLHQALQPVQRAWPITPPCWCWITWRACCPMPLGRRLPPRPRWRSCGVCARMCSTPTRHPPALYQPRGATGTVHASSR